MTEAEIIHLGIPFGRVTNVLVLKGKNQAFLEMEEEPSAIAMVNYFTNCVAQLRERSVYVQFSNHTSLKTDQTHSNASASAQAALQVGNMMVWFQPGSVENSTFFFLGCTSSGWSRGEQGRGAKHSSQGDCGAHGVSGHPRRHLPDLFKSWEGHEDCDIHEEQHFPGKKG